MEGNGEKKTYIRWIVAVVLIFALMGASIYGVAKKTYDDMSDAAIQNLNENLNLMRNTVEAIMRSEAEFQQLVAEEIAAAPDPSSYVLNLRNNDTTSKLSVVLAGEEAGVSNDGEPFFPEQLDFSAGGAIAGLPVSQSYVNDAGTWAYTIACPIAREGEDVGTLYAEYTYEAIDRSLPVGFYDKQAVLYLMDAATERFVLQPEGMGERDAGHLNLEDFYRANNVVDAQTLELVEGGIAEKTSVMFSHQVKGRDSLCYLWPVNDGTAYLVGYVPASAIQREAQAVNVALGLVIAISAAAFVLCLAIYAYHHRRQLETQRARAAERALHNEQLTRALQAAQAANESKSAFLANMSHDIRTPMNAVLGFTTIISKEADDPAKVRDCASKIMASGRHLLDLINDVLDISKIESGKATLNLTEFDLGDSLVAIESIIAPMARDKRQAFHTEIVNVDHERVIGDETHINQILINLLSNAVKYTPEGGDIWLRFIGLSQHSSQFERIRIEVEDNGYGMTPEFLETIFDSFTRAENSTTNKVQGTGLGMSITKSLVELMGGTIEAESVEGEGSLFRVDLELRIPEEQARGFFWSQQGIKSMLVVDRSAAGQKIAQAQMEGTGVRVDVAANRAEGMELARRAASEGGYQAIILCCGTLGEACAGAAEELRAAAAAEGQGAAGPVPVIFVPDHHFDREEGIPLPPCSGVLVRPFFASTLQHKIEDIVGTGRAAEVAAYDKVLEGKRFLAAEDNFLNAGILTELLELEGATVEIVENGQLAVERFEQASPGEFDAILMDVQMPVMNGHAAARAIRALDRADARTIPIIAMTADAFVEDEKAALAAGMNAHVAKPLEIDDLGAPLIGMLRKDEHDAILRNAALPAPPLSPSPLWRSARSLRALQSEGVNLAVQDEGRLGGDGELLQPHGEDQSRCREHRPDGERPDHRYGRGAARGHGGLPHLHRRGLPGENLRRGVPRAGAQQQGRFVPAEHRRHRGPRLGGAPGRLSGLSCAQNLREVVRVANTVDGKLVAIPQEVVAYGLFVNKDIFDECELSLPSTPEEFLECCRVLKEKGYETPVGANRWWLETFVFAQAYADLYNGGDVAAEMQALNAGRTRYSDYMRPGFEFLQTLIDSATSTPKTRW